VNGRTISMGANGNKMTNTRIIAIGGYGLSSVEMYESKTGTWTSLPDMTTKRLASALCIVGSKVIVAGGHDGNKYLSSTEYLDLEGKGRDMRWTVIPSMNETRSAVRGVLLDDGVTFFVTGGNNGESRLSSCEQLDTTTMTWSDAPSMATARSAHCTVLYKKKVVAIGGVNVKGSGFALCEEYDTSSKTWSAFPSLTATMFWHGACVLDDRIFVSGGRVNGSPSDIVEMYDGVK
jgi:serine/threonine-protein kinase PknK